LTRSGKKGWQLGEQAEMSRDGVIPETARHNDPNVHVVDYDTEPDSSLLPMLISGIVMIIVAMLAVMIFF
jgi:hypothetical protein